MKKIESIIWGIVLIVVGIIIFCNTLGITDINIFFSGWWCLFIIIPCFIGLLKNDDKTADIIGLLIGVLLLLCCQDIIDFYILWKLLLPIILVVVGITLILKNTTNHELNKKIKNASSKINKDNSYYATFSSQDIKLKKEKFSGTELCAVFGGIKFDLDKAIIDNDVLIDASSIFGGIEIYVPDDVSVVVKSTSIFGGVDNKCSSDKNSKKTIYVNAICLFGGIEIK